MIEKYEDLLKSVLKPIISDTADFKINSTIENTLISLNISASKQDKALIIGKGGQMIKAIRTILLVSAVRDRVGINLKVID